MKKWVIYLFIILISSLSVFAYSKDISLKWLLNANNIKWSEGAIDEKAFSLLALNSNDHNTEIINNILLQRKDPLNCYPKGNCNVKDTALMALALKSSNLNITGLLSWLDSTLTKAQISNWYIQIKTDKTGNCILTYDQINDEAYKTKKIFVNGTEKIKIDNKLVDWISVERDLQAVLDKPVENIEVDCTQINDQDIVISLLRILNNENDFYIIQESQSSVTDLTINNACYPSKKGGVCNEESSFYTAYVLNELDNNNIKVLPYLLDKADTNLENSILYKITNDQKFADFLISKQNKKGYWDNQDIYGTSFAINALRNSNYQEKIENSTEWLKSKQNADGSFGNVKNTGVAIYLALTEDYSIIGDDGNNESDSNETEDGDNSQENCQSDIDCSNPDNQYCDENTNICLPREISGSECETDSDCTKSDEKCENGICKSNEVTEDNPECETDSDCTRSDEKCENGICKSNEVTEDNPECETDSDCAGENEVCIENQCKINVTEKKGISLWVVLLVIIAVLGIGGYFFYTKVLKKPGDRKPNSSYSFEPSFSNKQTSQRIIPQKQPQKSYRRTNTDQRLETELDKSIKEAEKLLKK